ncbi:coiled-coil domain-containing protein [Persicitalea sp.]|uniref:coiled-coil domain-containing protein n=1 Tax=Persicitalea sp. TaxID=3100273 RepID=UPI0035942328
MKNLLLPLVVLGFFLVPSVHAQGVFPGKEKLNDKDYFGLNLNSSIPSRYLEEYWEDYLKTYGKTHSRRGVISVDRANIPAISHESVEMLSQVSSARNISHVFLAVKVGDHFVSNFTDSTYTATENFLKEFSDYAVARDEVRMAEEYYDEADKNHKNLERDNDRIVKEIERTQKKLEELMRDQETNKADLAGSVIDLENKQKDLEAAKARIPKM